MTRLWAGVQVVWMMIKAIFTGKSVMDDTPPEDERKP